MNKKIFFEYILPVIQPTLETQGFEYKKSKFGFYKKIEGGSAKISIDFYAFATTLNTNIGLGIRIDKVEEILLPYSSISANFVPDIKNKDFKDWNTWGTSVAPVSPERQLSGWGYGSKCACIQVSRAGSRQ